MNTSNNQNDITYICPECGGDKCTRVSKDRYRCLYCGATFYADNPDNQNDTGDDVAKSLQELDEQDKAEKVKMREIAIWLKSRNDYPALKQKHILSAFLSVVAALVGATLAFLVIAYIVFDLFDLDPESWSGWFDAIFGIGMLYCLWKALKWSFLLAFGFITGIYDNQFINKHEHELLSLFSKKDLETFRENYMDEELQ